MKSNKEILSSILKTTQMGQVGIRSVMDNAVGVNLRHALASQLREYDEIESEAHAIATERGWELPELNPGIKIMSGMMSRARLTGADTDSKIADMMIQGNTRGMIKSIKNLHRYHKHDTKISCLSQKLLDCENANIRQMQNYL